MLSSSISSLVKKSTQALQRSGSDKSKSKYEIQVDSINDPNRRPINVIRTDFEGEEGSKYKKHNVDVVEEIGEGLRNEFDEVSLSTHGSYHQVPVQNILIDVEERNVHHGLDSFYDDQDDDTLDQLRVQAEAFLDDQKRKNAELQQLLQQGDEELIVNDGGDPKVSHEELPFDCDDSLLGSSSLDGVLRRVKEDAQEQEQEKQPGISHDPPKDEPELLKSYGAIDDSINAVEAENKVFQRNTFCGDTPSPCQNQNDKDFNGEAFADLGKAMFRKQRERLNSHSESSSKVSSEKTDANEHAPFDESPAATVSALKEHKSKPMFGRWITILPVAILLHCLLNPWVLYGFIVRMFQEQSDDAFTEEVFEQDPDPELEPDKSTLAYQHNCSEESFHYAMYHLSNIAKECSQADSSIDPQSVGRFYTPICVTAFIAVLVGVGLVVSDFSWIDKDGTKVETAARSNSKKHHTPTPSKPKLRREVNSLEKKNIFTSSFVTDIVSPKGNIGSVKRSARIIKLSSYQQTKYSENSGKKEENQFIEVKSKLIGDFDDSMHGQRGTQTKAKRKSTECRVRNEKGGSI